MNTAELVNLVKANSEKSKNEVAAMLMENGASFSTIPKIIKKSEVKFGRAKSGTSITQRVIEIVVENPEIEFDEIEPMIEEFTTNPKYFARHVGGIVRETVRLINES